METEIWKNVVGYDGLYEVSNFGNVWNLTKNKKVNNYIRSGYSRVLLWKNGIKKMYSLHRIVATAFIENPENKLEVNHINAIKTDNNVLNLEWCTRQENTNHAVKLGLYPIKHQTFRHKQLLKEKNAIKIIDKNTGIVYNSITDAALELNYKKSTLIHYLLGTRKNKTSLCYL